MGRRLAYVAGLALACLASSGCGAAAPTPTAPIEAEMAPARGPIFAVRNESPRTICFVRFSPTHEALWGPDRLERTEVISPGETRQWAVDAAAYDVQLLDCELDPLLDRRGLRVARGGVLVTYR